MWAARFLSAVTSLLALVGLAIPAVVAPVVAQKAVQEGEALYGGKKPLRGRIRDHEDLLPPEAVRCCNCHSAASTSRLSAKPAPRLDADWLLEMHQRRNGPPSEYDQATFCRVLRSGIDPVHILVAREMPTYEIGDAQCSSLWQFLTREWSRKCLALTSNRRFQMRSTLAVASLQFPGDRSCKLWP